MKNYLSSHYAFRVNLLRQSTEWCALGADGKPQEPYRPLDDMTLNTLYFELCEARANGPDGKGSPTRHELECYLFSRFIPQYHPFRDYMSALPKWDGHDRVTPLANRVSNDPLWHKVFSIWLRALTAQWLGVPMQAANSMVPVLMSERQGLMKSTFCRLLMPEPLQKYYLDKLDFTQAGEYDRMMGQFGLINLDEMDRYSPAAMARFKSATQMKDIVGHNTRNTLITNTPRLASFIATTNQSRILRDRTGSRRFFCQRVEAPISCRPVNHVQLYAQLKAEVLNGQRTWFTKQEEAAIQNHNRQHYSLTPLQLAILQHFRPVTEEELHTRLPNGQKSVSLPTVPAAEIYAEVSRSHPRLTAGLRLCDFAKQLPSIFLTTPRKPEGYRYYAERISA